MASHSEAQLRDEVYAYLNRQPGRRAVTQAVYSAMALRFADPSLATREGSHQVRFAILRLRDAGLVLSTALSDRVAWELSGSLLDGDKLLQEMCA